MNRPILYSLGCSESCRYASGILGQKYFHLTDHPTPEITHLLLDIPSFDGSGVLRDGTSLTKQLRMLPGDVTVIGGNLDLEYLRAYSKMDLLKDARYLAKNAAITAECALKVAAPYLNVTIADAPALILGWGRIGKCLAKILSSLGCPVTVAARKESDRAILEALGYRAVDFCDVPYILDRYRILFNTVPNLPLQPKVIEDWAGIPIDLASYPGMEAATVIPARGLPGKYAPESSGKLIADTVLRFLKEEAK